MSNHKPHDCLFNCLFERRSKKTSKLHVTGLCEGNSPVTSEFPAQRTSNAEKISIWWCHHAANDLHSFMISVFHHAQVCLCIYCLHLEFYFLILINNSSVIYWQFSWPPCISIIIMSMFVCIWSWGFLSNHASVIYQYIFMTPTVTVATFAYVYQIS